MLKRPKSSKDSEKTIIVGFRPIQTCFSKYSESHLDGLSPPVKYFTVRSKAHFFCGSFMFLFCLVFAMSLCASVYMCFAVTCWERADLLALVCGVCCEFVTFPLVSWVRCGT